MPLILKLLNSREFSFKPSVVRKLNWTILREVIAGGNVQKIGEYIGSGSCSRIIYCEGHLLINGTSKNNLQIINLNGNNGKPLKKVKKLHLPDDWKDRDFGIGPFPASSSFLINCGFKVLLYAVTARKLLSIDFHNGLVANEILLPNNSRYTELTLDDETHLLAASSVKNPKGDVLMNFALYSYYPKLEYQGSLFIKKSTYGESITGAEISQGLLLTLHKGNRLKIFSFPSAIENKDSCPPVLMDIVSYNHVVAIGANPYYRIHATHYNSFIVSRLSDERDDYLTIEGQDNSFDPYLGFHPDSSPRLIFTDNGLLRLYDIVMDTYGAHSLVPAAVHTLETSKSRAEFPAQATTTSGRTIKRPSQSLIYSRTSYEDSSTFLAWDYEDDMDILGVVYVQQDEDGVYMDLILDLVDSPTDADLCLVSISRNGRAVIRVFRFTPHKAA